MKTQLCLGTVQFGMAYGITNDYGKVQESEVKRILTLAAQQGVELMDTAQAYGTSEDVLGRCWPVQTPRRLISKLPPYAAPESWELAIQSTLRRLNTPRLDTFLLHRAADLTSSYGDKLLDWLESLKYRGLTDRIGVSIYDASELDNLPLDRLQLVQLPLSIYDQRLLMSGTIDYLYRAGIAVHARSTFLQGLILTDPESWPLFLSTPFQEHHYRFKSNLGEYGLSLLDGALSFASSCEGLEAVLVGVLSANEMQEILQSWHKPFPREFGSPLNWAWDNASDLDPRNWPK